MTLKPALVTTRTPVNGINKVYPLTVDLKKGTIA
jgi:hypothetical protein